MTNIPILFLVFNRPDTTQKVFEEIKKAKPRRLFIAADGARNHEEWEKCNQVRDIVNKVNWDCEVKTLFQEQNHGCKEAITKGINWFFDNVEQGIILEDDCMPCQSFFRFCSDMLDYYRDDARIMHISGSNFQDGIKRGDGSYYFSKLMHCWGWATWKRAWKLNRKNFEGYDEFIKNDLISSIFEKQQHKNFWIHYFNEVQEGRISTWDFAWSYSVFVNNGICIIPNNNFVSNIGFGNNSTHCTVEVNGLSDIKIDDNYKLEHPTIIKIDKKADNYTSDRYFSYT